MRVPFCTVVLYEYVYVLASFPSHDFSLVFGFREREHIIRSFGEKESVVIFRALSRLGHFSGFSRTLTSDSGVIYGARRYSTHYRLRTSS